jgi:DNA recombination protein RmuC
MDLAVLVLGFVLCAAIGAVCFLLGAARARRGADARTRQADERLRLAEERTRQADDRLREAETRAGAAGARAEALAEQLHQAAEKLGVLETALRQSDSKRAAETARAEALARNLVDQRELLDGAKAQLGDTFQALAAEALRASQEGFLTLASERLGAVRNETTLEVAARHEAQQKAIEGMVAPVRASLAKVDEQIQAMERVRGSAYGSLAQQMQAIAETQEKLRTATGNLVSALKAPAVRGQWGEMQLRRVVEMAGMIDHCDFHQQVTVNVDEGRLRPDMVVRLPGGRNIVVDAKAPMAAYLAAREAATDEERAEKLRQHAAQVRAHISKLSAKSYWDQMDVPAEVVVMFLPGESLYSAALEQMPGLIEEGFAQKVLVATPTTLLGLLRAMGYAWREERLAENAQRISEEGRRLHERISTVLEHFADLGRALGQSVKHFNAAMVSFDRRVVVSARKLEELDAKGKKELGDRAQIDARPFTVSTAADEGKRRLPPQQPVLTLALSADDGT